MPSGDILEEGHFAGAYILDRLVGHWLRQESDEVAGMPSSHGHADLTVVLHAANAGTVPGTGIESDAIRAARAAACSYRERMADYEEMRSLDVWYDAIDVDRFLKAMDSDQRRAPDPRARVQWAFQLLW